MTLQAPFPYFGGKRRAASLIWQALGDPGGYVEPFAGSAAVLLARPPFVGRRVETLNDADGWLVNTWRAIQLSPDEVAKHCAGPVTEIDYHARLAWLQARRDADLVAWLEGDPEHHDAKAAGWWLYVVACGIGDPWGSGPWQVIDGYLRNVGNAGRGVNRELPHLGDAGRGELRNMMRRLARRLERVRITCGDWRRVVSPSVMRASATNNVIGVLLDPPYLTGGDLYAHGSADVAHAVREWCLTADPLLRIVLCGYAGEHDVLEEHGWRVQNGKAGGPGYGGIRTTARERLWMSPACLDGQLRLGLDA
ncbi:MAG: DNA adenine methylase [Chloroflexi bacterium]|nr:DNA adenine methylase [Chloroflexota bacterium]